MNIYLEPRLPVVVELALEASKLGAGVCYAFHSRVVVSRMSDRNISLKLKTEDEHGGVLYPCTDFINASKKY